MATIDFFCLIGGNSVPYVDFMKKTCDVIKSGHHKILWKAIETIYTGKDARRDIQKKKSEKSKEFKYLDSITDRHKDASENHADALHAILKHVKSEYVIIGDVDIAVTFKNWDDWIVKSLNSFDCVGFQYRYHMFPSPQFFCFKKSLLKKRELDFRPKTRQHRVVKYRLKDKEEAKLFGRRVGATIVCDTGWRLPLVLGGCTSYPMPRIFGNSPKHQLPFRNARQKKYCIQTNSYRTMSEFHADGKLFGTHMLASRVHDYHGRFAATWRDRISIYFKKEYGIIL